MRGDPNDGDAAVRYTAALFASDDCARASAQAERARVLRPSSAIPPLVLGRCSERVGEFEEARRIYLNYLAGSPTREGIEAVLAQDEIAARSQARQQALRALEQEAELGDPDPQAMAVLSWDVGASEDLAPLSIGLARLVSSDLIQLRRFRLLERIRLTEILNELELGQTDLVARETAPRLGRLIGAGQLLQGTLAGSPDTPITLSANVTQSTGDVVSSETRSSDYQDLLILQKELVLQLVRDLGYELTEAERQTILENGTRSLAAFLAFSRGLHAEALGDYEAAQVHFDEAVALDPEFEDARRELRTLAAVMVVQDSPPHLITTVEADAYAAATAATQPVLTITSIEQDLFEFNPMGAAVVSSISDIAATQGESAGQGSGASNATKQINQLTKPVILPGVYTALVRIMIQIPPEDR